MAENYHQVKEHLEQKPKNWLVTGAAGFIGSNLVETLLGLGQSVVGLDNFATGHRHNLEDLERSVGKGVWSKFSFIEGDIRNLEHCRQAAEGADYVLHQAALGSVPRSIEDPLSSNQANVDGFLNMLVAARDQKVRRFVYASSSSVYGDSPGLPKIEDTIGAQLSPYAVSKRVNELYAKVFASAYGMGIIGLRYFNVFGPRQDPQGAYAAVIPKWIGLILGGEKCLVYGDGETSRDFCYVDNAVQANILSAVVTDNNAIGQVYNVAVGEQTSLLTLYKLLSEGISSRSRDITPGELDFAPFRAGDVRHSLADISRARSLLAYQPQVGVEEGIENTVAWFLQK